MSPLGPAGAPTRQLFLAATGQNRGKTTTSLGLLDGFRRRGFRNRNFDTSPRWQFAVRVRFDRVVDLGVDEDAGERRMAPVVGIERRFAHQPVDAGLGTQMAVSVLAGDFQRGAFDAGHFSG